RWKGSSGLGARVDVGPERLATHLGLAFEVFAGQTWPGLEARAGLDANRPSRAWTGAAGRLVGGVFVQCLLGGAVAGAAAGLLYPDWPLMNGAFFPPIAWGQGAFAFLHDQGLVQLNHRIGAYALLFAGTFYAVQALRGRLDGGLGVAAVVFAGALWFQA